MSTVSAVAQTLIDEYRLDARTIVGTGLHGEITPSDVARLIAQGGVELVVARPDSDPSTALLRTEVTRAHNTIEQSSSPRENLQALADALAAHLQVRARLALGPDPLGFARQLARALGEVGSLDHLLELVRATLEGAIELPPTDGALELHPGEFIDLERMAAAHITPASGLRKLAALYVVDCSTGQGWVDRTLRRVPEVVDALAADRLERRLCLCSMRKTFAVELCLAHPAHLDRLPPPRESGDLHPTDVFRHLAALTRSDETQVRVDRYTWSAPVYCFLWDGDPSRLGSRREWASAASELSAAQPHGKFLHYILGSESESSGLRDALANVVHDVPSARTCVFAGDRRDVTVDHLIETVLGRRQRPGLVARPDGRSLTVLSISAACEIA